MKTETFQGTVENYQGKKVEPVIEYSGTVEVYENVAEAKTSENWPGDSEVLKMVNTKLLTAAKASKYQEQTKSLKEAYESSWDYQRANFIKVAMASNMFTQAEAEALVDSRKPAGV